MVSMLGRVVGLALLAYAAAEAPKATLISSKKYLPEPYGHTANVSPHAPNRDREWYTEYRWKQGKYQPQDGPVTTLPKHAPVPPPAKDVTKEKFGGVLNKKPERSSTKDEDKDAATAKQADYQKGTAGGAGSATGADKVKWDDKANDKSKAEQASKDVDLDSKNAVRPPGVGGATTAVKQEPSYAVPPPCGHTSQVHPFHPNQDREWYTENRWKPGTEYKPQDGPITEKPKHDWGAAPRVEHADGPCRPH